MIDLKNPQTQLLAVIAIIVIMIGLMYQKLGTATEASTGVNNNGFIDSEVADNNAGAAPSGATLELSDTDHIRGNADADIIVFEFSDYECPFCERHHQTMQSLIDTYEGQVAWVYNHFPLSMHAHAQDKAEAAECVAELGGNESFWTFTDELFAAGTQTSVSQLPGIAAKSGVSESDFQECYDSGRHASTVQAAQNLGLSAGVQGTPGNVVVNVATGEQQLIPGALPLSQFKAVIDGML